MILIIAILFGFIAGWLVNYLSDVLPTLRKLSRPACAHCGAIFRWRDYLLLSACPECKQARSWRSYIVIVLSIMISTALWLNAPVQLGYWISLLVLTYFGVVMVIDLEHRLILHMVSLAGAVIGLIAGIASNGLFSTIAGGVAGLGIMLVFYLFGMLFAHYRARKLGVNDGEEALGFGDVILAGVIGLMLGWPHILTGLLVAILAGGLISLLIIVILSAMRRFESMNVFTAYGPYLVLGAAILMFFPQVIWFLPFK
jgi:prepilin signal peptidase PulO-like enzyme (type II secretory pathway)